MNNIIEVLSNNPPGGRCSLYQGYAEVLGKVLGIEWKTRFPEVGTPDADLVPGLRLIGQHVKAEDGVIVSPEDVIAVVRGLNKVEEGAVSELQTRLESLIDEVLGG